MSMHSRRPHVVIVGAGFGGLSAAMALRNVPVDITIIDRHNYHLFQPLLYQVATASLSPAEIAQPIRSILRDQANARVLLDEVTGIDTARKVIRAASGQCVAYDHLIIATGARHSYFGKEQWEARAPGIKSVDDATRVRGKILTAFERAEVETDPVKREALLTFVIVGGGPTGVEMAGAISELARHSITRDFRSITPHCAQIVLVEAGPRLLPAFPESLSAEAKRGLEAKGVDVRVAVAVGDLSSDSVAIGNEMLPAKTVIWAAGVRASAAGQWLGATVDRAGRVIVGDDFSVPSSPDIFVIGDTAAFRDKSGRTLPGVAPAAKQAGVYVAQVITARVYGRPAPRPFVYRDFGNLATIGRQSAVADFGAIKLKGLIGWLLWSVVHVYFLIGFRNRAAVAANWAWSYLTYQRGVRLITGTDEIMMRAEMRDAA